MYLSIVSPVVAIRSLGRLAALLLLAGLVVHADDKTSIPEGFRQVKLPGGGSIMVKDQPKPQGSSNPDPSHYDPRDYDLNKTSPLANQSFVSDTAPLAQSDFANAKSSYATKSYGSPTGTDRAMPHLDSRYPTSASNSYSRSAGGFDKTYLTKNSDLTTQQTASFASTTSSDQGRMALFDEHPQNTFESPLAHKTYAEPIVQRDADKIASGELHIADLPNRPLTVDEVRDLINHGVKPDTDSPPPPVSKPLNDPDYLPPAAPPADDSPPQDQPSPTSAPAPASEDDKNDPVPAPGMIAEPPPENSESLPQH